MAFRGKSQPPPSGSMIGMRKKPLAAKPPPQSTQSVACQFTKMVTQKHKKWRDGTIELIPGTPETIRLYEDSDKGPDQLVGETAISPADASTLHQAVSGTSTEGMIEMSFEMFLLRIEVESIEPPPQTAPPPTAKRKGFAPPSRIQPPKRSQPAPPSVGAWQGRTNARDGGVDDGWMPDARGSQPRPTPHGSSNRNNGGFFNNQDDRDDDNRQWHGRRGSDGHNGHPRGGDGFPSFAGHGQDRADDEFGGRGGVSRYSDHHPSATAGHGYDRQWHDSCGDGGVGRFGSHPSASAAHGYDRPPYDSYVDGRRDGGHPSANDAHEYQSHDDARFDGGGIGGGSYAGRSSMGDDHRRDERVVVGRASSSSRWEQGFSHAEEDERYERAGGFCTSDDYGDGERAARETGRDEPAIARRDHGGPASAALHEMMMDHGGDGRLDRGGRGEGAASEMEPLRAAPSGDARGLWPAGGLLAPRCRAPDPHGGSTAVPYLWCARPNPSDAAYAQNAVL